jgi:integrase
VPTPGACNPDERPLLVILAHTLARIDEILRLTWQDVNFDQATVTPWTRKNKAGEWKARIISMNSDLRRMLLDMWNRRLQEKWVFFNPRENNPYLRRPKFMKSLCRRAAIPEYGFHAIRHFKATYLHDIMKVPTGVLSGILGHENRRVGWLGGPDTCIRAWSLDISGVKYKHRAPCFERFFRSVHSKFVLH